QILREHQNLAGRPLKPGVILNTGEKMLRPFRKFKPFKTILSLNVDFSSDTKSNLGDLEPGKSFYYEKRDRKTTYEEVKDYLIETVEIDLKRSLTKISDNEIVSINVMNEYTGSIELTIAIVFGTISTISGIKGFYDSITMIKNQTRKFISRKLKNKYGIEFDVNTGVEYPTIERFYPEEFFWRLGKRGFFPFSMNENPNHSTKRDGFFYYLLVSNIVLLVILFFMVYKTVFKQFGW
ncbi:MAG: hypothetical protein MJE63_17555, partial [Proteobacteria bacterium]|nr:hypothetical protein [Pseudomonadota bacterium]